MRHGAPAEILTQGAPHLGTDGLIGILKSLRGQLTELGVDLRFGTRLLGLETEDGACVGVRVLGAGGEIDRHHLVREVADLEVKGPQLHLNIIDNQTAISDANRELNIKLGRSL